MKKLIIIICVLIVLVMSSISFSYRPYSGIEIRRTYRFKPRYWDWYHTHYNYSRTTDTISRRVSRRVSWTITGGASAEIKAWFIARARGYIELSYQTSYKTSTYMSFSCPGRRLTVCKFGSGWLKMGANRKKYYRGKVVDSRNYHHSSTYTPASMKNTYILR